MQTDKPPITDIVSIVAHKKSKRTGGDSRRIMRMQVADAGSGKYRVLKPSDYGRLAIDTRYQREEVADWVATLRDAIKRGSVPPPIQLVKRLFEENGVVSDKLWIVDGQQRMWALVDLEKDIPCYIHEVDSLDKEKRLFHVFNTHRRPSANHLIASHTGPTTALLHEIDADETHSLHRRILLANYAGSHNRIACASLVTVLGRAFTGGSHGGPYEKLAMIDPIVRTSAGATTVRAFLDSLGRIFVGKPGFQELMALAAVYKQMDRCLTASEEARIKRLKLETVVAATASERVHLMVRRMLGQIGFEVNT